MFPPSPTHQLSELDARVLNELLVDPSFIESFLESGASAPQNKGENGTDSRAPSCGTLKEEGILEPGAGLLYPVSDGSARLPERQGSDYESGTMRLAEEVQQSVRGLIAKISATIESAGMRGYVLC